MTDKKISRSRIVTEADRKLYEDAGWEVTSTVKSPRTGLQLHAVVYHGSAHDPLPIRH